MAAPRTTFFHGPTVGSVMKVGRPRLRAALVASAVLHLAGVLALFVLAPPAPRPVQSPAPVPIEISVAEAPPPAPPAPAPAPVSPPQSPTPAPPPRPPATPAPPAPPPPGPAAPPAPAPRAEEAPGPPVPGPPVDLSFDSLAAGAKQNALGPASGGADVPIIVAPRPGRRSVDELRSEAERERDAI